MLSMSELRKRVKSQASGPEINQYIPKQDAESIVSYRFFNRHRNHLLLFARMVGLISLAFIIYYGASNKEKYRIFASQKDTYSGKGLVVDCSEHYMQEMNRYEGCLPKECGRYVTDSVVTVEEADALKKIADRGFKFGESLGGASILDLHSGALSRGDKFVNIYQLKDAKDLFTDEDFDTYRVVKDKVKTALAHHFYVNPDKIFLTHPTFFSKITSKPAVTIHDEYWHPHVDKETYKSFHYTTLLYLSDYQSDFYGGRFVFIDQKANSTVEPRKGRVSMFTSGAENLHYVEKVSAGLRHAITISFTCDDRYSIEDPSHSKYL